MAACTLLCTLNVFTVPPATAYFHMYIYTGSVTYSDNIYSRVMVDRSSADALIGHRSTVAVDWTPAVRVKKYIPCDLLCGREIAVH